jgi:Tol biopolymer transport system component
MSGRLALAVAALALCVAATALAARGETVLVSGPNVLDGNIKINDQVPAISADGRYIAFVRDFYSTASAVYLRDMRGGTVPVDVPAKSMQDAGTPSISGNGRFVAFASDDPDISDEDVNTTTSPIGDTYNVRDIFVFDRATSSIELASRRSGVRGEPGGEDSSLPSISRNGRYVAFQTNATNLLRGSYGGIFVRDLRRHTTVAAAPVPLRRHGLFEGGYAPSISGNGRYVAFLTIAPHRGRARALLVAVRDMKRKRSFYASRAGRHLPNAECGPPSISANGRYVAFSTKAKNLSRIDRGDVEDVFVRDLKKRRTLLVSRAKGKRGANGDSSRPSISADGRFVAFESYATNLGPRDNPAIPDVFVRDMRTGRVFLASRGSEGVANAPSANPAISADGRFVAFDSRGSNLAAGDTLHATSIFRYRLP